jgi:hypothetical protein
MRSHGIENAHRRRILNEGWATVRRHAAGPVGRRGVHVARRAVEAHRGEPRAMTTTVAASLLLVSWALVCGAVAYWSSWRNRG